jgi:hypothetical protein
MKKRDPVSRSFVGDTGCRATNKSAFHCGWPYQSERLSRRYQHNTASGSVEKTSLLSGDQIIQ